jgi:hypothetical protein
MLSNFSYVKNKEIIVPAVWILAGTLAIRLIENGLLSEEMLQNPWPALVKYCSELVQIFQELF